MALAKSGAEIFQAAHGSVGVCSGDYPGRGCRTPQVADRLDDAFLQTVELFARCTGRICITGTGKSADVGQKIAGTLNSTGTRAYVLDATRAMHGDLGMLHPARCRAGAEPQRRERGDRPPVAVTSAIGSGFGGADQQQAKHPGPSGRLGHRAGALWKKSARSAWPPAPAPRP